MSRPDKRRGDKKREDSKQQPEEPRARGPDAPGRIVEAYFAAGAAAFGNRWMAFPGQDSYRTAEQMIEAGLKPERAEGVFTPLMDRLAKGGSDPPRSMRYALPAVRDFVASGVGGAERRVTLEDYPEWKEKIEALK